MKLMWEKFGKSEVAYDVKDIEETLIEYSGKELAENFFSKHIYGSEMPDYKTLLETVGVELTQATEENYFGASFKDSENGIEVSRNTFKNSPAYIAGLDKGDLITAINGEAITSVDQFEELIKNSSKRVGLKVNFTRFGTEKTTEVKLSENPEYRISLMEKADKEQLKNRENWLDPK